MEWKNLFTESMLRGGQEYINNGSIKNVLATDSEITGDVSGIDDFHIKIELVDNAISKMNCTCPLAQSGVICKHMAAVLLAWENMSRTSNKHDNTSGPENTERNPEAPEITPPTMFGEENNTAAEEPVPESNAFFIPKYDGRIELEADINTFFSYALQQNRVAIVRTVTVKNASKTDLEDLSIRVWTDVDLIDDFVEKIDILTAGEEHCFRNLKIMVHGDYLASLTERISCILYVSVTKGNEELARQSEDISVLAFDQWPGFPRYFPDLLAAFITPNHPAMAGLLQGASKYLEKWTGDPSLEGYQSGDPNRVLAMAGAAYAAIQEKNITYSSAPASFEDMGQRVRLIDQMLEEHFGTCLDMTLLYAGLLEAMHLNTILVMRSGHIFAGVWIVDDTFPDPWTDDPSQLEKRLADGVNEVIVVECTAMCSGKNISFDQARIAGENNVNDYVEFEFSIDITRARRSGVRPLPVRVKGENGYVIEHHDLKEKDVTSAPSDWLKLIDTSDTDGQKQEVTKQTQWERKLLDLSLRNMLINMRITGTIIPMLTADLPGLEDALAEGVEYEVLDRPAEWEIHRIDYASTETVNDLGPYGELIELEEKHRRLHSWLGEKELSKLLTKMYRSAKSSMEENGASTLYMTLGLLRWFDGIKTPKVHYAPVILLPIDIIRKSASKGYVIRERDDDAQVNITLLEFLKQNYEIEIPGLNPPPKDDHGLDVEKIFAIIRHAVMNQKMWDVIEDAFIGNFSFSQFVMWNDIHSRSDLLERNKIVHGLMEGAVDWDCSIPESVDTDDAYLPVPVDSSQLRAINMAANGVSFVLHGPPGTGKSQTITAMIANALTKGRTVLFVAEKMAALEVVQKRLASLGIEDFCLELHSNKAVKKNVLDQLKRGLDIRVWGMSTDYDQKIEEIHQMRSELDAYAKKLHERRNCGFSVRELIDEYESIPENVKTYRVSRDYVNSCTQQDLEFKKKLLLRLIDAGKQLGHPKGHVFSVVGQTEYTQSLRRQLEDAYYDYEKSMDSLQGISAELSEITGEDRPVSVSRWNEFFEFTDCIFKAEEIPDFLLKGEPLEQVFQKPLEYITLRDQYIGIRNDFTSKYNESILTADLNVFARRFEEANRKFFGKAKAIKEVISSLQQYVKFPVGEEQLSSISAGVDRYRQITSRFETAKAELSEYWNAYLKDSTTKDELIALKAEWDSQLNGIRRFSGVIETLKESGNYSRCTDLAKKIADARRTMLEKEQVIKDLLKLNLKDNETDWIGGKKELIKLLDEHFNELRDWITYRGVKAECESNGLQDICRMYEEGLDHEELIPVFYKSVYKSLIWAIIEEEPVLNKFTGNSFNEKIKEYKRMEQEFIDLTKEEMYYKLTHNLPTGHEGVEMSKELAILRKAISSGGRGLSIRNLFDQIPHVLMKLCPCLLMSPISVAQYLSVDNDTFDVVIFDEASQLPTCKAVGVLARGKDAVIVGDPNQMPPTSFFAGNMIDEDNLDIEDLDSILDDCLALGMPQTHLQWHYRSRHESLIAFSNQEYYENSMLTFPSVNDREKRVKLCTVNGTFNRKKGRINEEEGRAVVKEVLRRYNSADLTDQSIGIVTFNISQQGLIEDLLAEEYKKDAQFDKWANEKDEELFVKNLENVQGDERDVILFSVGFGPDDDGKLSLNFGPLNREGGWKRLNVAVTRARLEMVVFSSMTPEMIDLNRTKAKGVEGLRAFLEFADKGRLAGGGFEASGKAKGITKQICDAIEAKGLKVQRNIGHSDFKIDIAVVNPYDENEYILGIMLDGNTYKRSKNTKDREISQLGVLSGLGWNLHRIWTMDWWDNQDKELSSLMEIIEEKKEEARIAFEEGKPKDKGPESEEIKYQKPEDNKPREKKEKKEDKGNGSFETHEKFAPRIPHTQSKDELSDLVQSVQDEMKATEVVSKVASLQYELTDFVSADVKAEQALLPSEFSSKAGKEIILGVIQEIVRIEAPVSLERLVPKVLRAVQIGRGNAELTDATEKLIKKLDVTVNKQNGLKYIWRSDQNPDTYQYYRVDASCDDKRSMSDISQQELKNAICIAIRNKGPLGKDALIKETVRVMGYGRSGATIVEAIERGLKYGRKTGEIMLNDKKEFVLGR